MIKKYERYIYGKKDKVWVVPLKMPDFIISLQKIGMNDKEIDRWTHLHNVDVFTNNDNNPETITIKKDCDHGGFTWYPYPTSKSNSYMDFMGKLKITPEEIENYYNNIKIKEDSKKYNI